MTATAPGRLGLYSRAMLIIGSVLAAITLGATLWHVYSGQRRLSEELDARLAQSATQAAVSVSSSLWDLNRDTTQTVLRGLVADPDFHAAQVLDEKGRVFVQVGKTTVAERDVANRQADILFVVDGVERKIGTLSLSFSRDRLVAARQKAILDDLVLGLVQLAAVLAATGLALRAVIRPLAAITGRMVEVAKGDLEHPPPHAERADQIGEMARAVEAFRARSLEARKAETELRQARDELELRVTERTSALRASNEALAREVAERRRSEEAREASEGRFRSIIDHSPTLIMLKDPRGRYLVANRRFEEWHGRPVGSILGRTAREAQLGEQIERVAAKDEDVINTRSVIEDEHDVPFADGTTHRIMTTKFPVFDGSGRVVGVGIIGSDVTAQRAAEERLRHSERIKAVGQLTGGVAHDFNNLLAIILGHAEFLEDRLPREQGVRAILRAASRGAELTQRLLAFSRQQPLQPTTIELSQLVQGMADLLRRTLGETIAIEIRAPEDLWPATADAGQVENALLNLAINARDAMPSGGRLIIETANARLDESYASAQGDLAAGDYVSLTVTDSGGGMPPSVLAHAFEPFFTTKDIGQGSGLGLSMVYGFVKQSGGHVTITSEVDRGTTVRLYLPRAAAQGAAAQATAAGALEPRARGESVLVLEDDPDVRSLAVSALKQLGYRVAAAQDGPSALATISTVQTIDLLLSDVVLAGQMSGPDVVAEARRHVPSLRVLYMSGYAENSLRERLEEVRGEGMLRKPFRRVELARMVRDALDRIAS